MLALGFLNYKDSDDDSMLRMQKRALINPTSFSRKGIKIPGKADPIGRKDLVFYGDIKNRGYLAINAGIPIPPKVKKARYVVAKEAEIVV